MKTLPFLFLTIMLVPVVIADAQSKSSSDLLDRVTHGYADNAGVKLHYVTVGDGPLIVMLHGFPDYWYTWRDQMVALEDDFKVVAMDLRAYNLSDQPKGVENYQMQHLMNDVIAVIKSQGQEKAIVVGHDWGGAIAWQLAINHPDVVEKLIVCNMTHPTGYSKASLQALQDNGNESYMDDFRKHTSKTLPVTWLCGWVTDAAAKKHYMEAFNRSYVDGMLDYYRANTKTKEQRAEWLNDPQIEELPKVNVPVLAIFGTKDQYVSKKGLNDTWDWLQQDFTLITIPDAAHFVQQDASEKVSQSMKMWLLQDSENVSAQTTTSPIAELEWVLGSWQRNVNGGRVVEQWTRVSPGTFEGKSFRIDSTTDDIKALEDLMITAMGGEIFYVPKVAENDLPVAFKLVSQGEKRLVFENPSHDFPQRIEYELDDNGKLTVMVSDMGREKVIPFHFERE